MASVRSGRTGFSSAAVTVAGDSAAVISTHAVTSVLKSTPGAVFGTFSIMAKQHAAHNARTIGGILLRTLQMLAFALSSTAGYSWSATTIAPIQWLADLTTLAGYMPYMNAQAYLTLYYVGLAYVALFIALFAWAAVSFARNSWPVLWPLRLLSAMGSLSATTLYIPLFYLLMSGFQCNNTVENPFWQQLGYVCYSGGHLAQTVLVAMLTAAFVTLCALFTLVYFDSNPLSVNLAAKVHGRADFVFLLTKSLLVVLVEVYPHSIGPPALTAVVIISGLIWAGTYLYLLPHIHHSINSFIIAAACVYLWAGVCLLLAQTYPSYDAAVMLYMGAPLAAVLGVYLTNARVLRITRRSVAALRSPYEVEMKARFFLHEALWGHATDELRPMDEALAAEAAVSVATGDAEKGEAHSAPVKAIDDSDAHDDSEVRMLQARRLLASAGKDGVLKEAEKIYRSGMSKFKHSSILHVLAARFFSVFCDNHHLEMSNLMRAERRSPRVDEAFLIFQARRAAEDNTGSRGSMSALNRVSFEKHMTDARRHMHSALSRQAHFWAVLQDAQPDLTKLHSLTSHMNNEVAAAERAFTELLSLNSQSLVVLRLYADFQMYVVNNSDKAAVLIAEAERIEEQQAKDHQRESGAAIRIMEQSNLDVMADNTAMVTIGGQSNNLGIIQSVSPYTCKLFGYSRWQMERRNISMIIPAPLSGMHDMFLRRYLESGEGRVVNYTRIVFGLHRLGYIFPLLLAVRETPASDGPPAFVGIMRTIATSEEHLLLTETGRITAATQSSLAMLAVAAPAMTSEDLRIQDFVPEWDVSPFMFYHSSSHG